MTNFSEHCIYSVDELLNRLHLKVEDSPLKIIKTPEFPFAVSKHYVAQMRKKDWYDPLLLQILPREAENRSVRDFVDDAVGDISSMVAPGLIHKYKNRVLFLLNQSCLGNCRFCFRRNLSNLYFTDEREAAFEYIKKNRQITEVLISGGEPMLLSNTQLEEFLKEIEQIPNVSTLRIHSRLAVMLPQRFDAVFFDIISKFSQLKNCVFVLHVNHSRELSTECRNVLSQLKQSGVLLFSQTVLLNGINDTPETLGELFSEVLSAGVVPYYLHQLDRARGTSHFEVDQGRGLEIVQKLREKLPGYAIPRYVRDDAGALCKTPIG
ncbi:Lysyl-lysine 2,3-aminomutase [Chitinispirillum alkaliphilum]|nr:Lysyl-lysine 2,3-aminomutase [Chitinispirillum alkaliphilum]